MAERRDVVALTSSVGVDEEDEAADMVGELRLGGGGGLDFDFPGGLEILKAKAAHPEMFVSGFEVDEQGIEGPDDPNCPGERLLTAAEEGNLEVVKELLQEFPDLVGYKDKDGYTALHRASYTDNQEMVRFLVSKKAKVDEVTGDGWTSLHSACHWNSFRAVRELVDNDADVNARTVGGQTPLHIASSQQAQESMIIVMRSPNINFSLKNKQGETAEDLARRSGRFHYLFSMSHEAINKL